jgi:hypothetical protein
MLIAVANGYPCQTATILPGLNPGEPTASVHLKRDMGLRLKQERIAWNFAWPRLVALANENGGFSVF